MYIYHRGWAFQPFLSLHAMWSWLTLVCQRRRAEAPRDAVLRGPGALEGSLQEIAQWLDWETWSVFCLAKNCNAVDYTLNTHIYI